MNNKTLAQLYAEHEGKVSDKWSHYLIEYERIFSEYRNKPVTMLEIGIQNGGSLEIWGQYFPNGEKFIGCDINPDCSLLQYNDPRIRLVIGDANSDNIHDAILQHSPNFDFVIDDGSHLSSDIIKSFIRYFPHITNGGLFVAEDLHCSYWQEYEGGLFDPFSSITFFKFLADIINHEHWGIEKKRIDLFTGLSKKYDLHLDETVFKQVHSIEFTNSTCVVRKSPIQRNLLGKRIIAGRIEGVFSGLSDITNKIPPQAQNYWSSRKLPPSEELPIRLHELTELQKNIEHLNRKATKCNKQFKNLNKTVAERNSQIKKLNKAVFKHDAQINLRNLAIAKRDALITSLLYSRSWRITQPLRSMRPTFNDKSDSKSIQPFFSRRFSPRWYLKENPDVAANGIDPYVHYMLEGIHEGRRPVPDSVIRLSLKRLKRTKAVLTNTLKRNGGIRSLTRNTVAKIRRGGWKELKQSLILLHARTTDSVAQSDGFNRNDYSEWVHRYDTLTDGIRATMRDQINNFDQKPLISVVMPTYNPKPEWLIDAIESVREQIYPNWELCIADDASTDKAVRPILERYMSEDSRIKVTFREHNGHISASSNSALELVTGKWIALLDHDDLLSEHALFWVVDAIHQNPNARMIYSDEDKLDETGRRFSPYFKCDWNLDLFYSHNMFSHLGVYRADILKDIDGFREGLEGAQDYDLALRCIERIETDSILHIPRVLYHWRMHAESTAHSADAKPYAMLAGESALNDHFKRQKINARSKLINHGYRAHYFLPESPPLVSIIIPTRNGLHLLRQCIESLLKKTTYNNFEILIIDNESNDPKTLKYLDNFQSTKQVRVVRDDRPFNYSALNNNAVKLAQGELVCLLNNDIEVISPEWLSEMVSIALQEKVGAVGARLWYPDQTLQHGGVILGLGASRVAGHSHYQMPKANYGYFGRSTLISSFSAVSAACMVIRKSIYEEVEGLNETDLQVAFNDVDFCLRVREKGYRNIWTPYAELYHHESATRGYEDTPEKQARFAKEEQYMKQRWGDQLFNDPAYSPNLTLDHEDFSFAWPPRVSTDYGLKRQD